MKPLLMTVTASRPHWKRLGFLDLATVCTVNAATLQRSRSYSVLHVHDDNGPVVQQQLGQQGTIIAGIGVPQWSPATKSIASLWRVNEGGGNDTACYIESVDGKVIVRREDDGGINSLDVTASATYTEPHVAISEWGPGGVAGFWDKTKVSAGQAGSTYVGVSEWLLGNDPAVGRSIEAPGIWLYSPRQYAAEALHPIIDDIKLALSAI